MIFWGGQNLEICWMHVLLVPGDGAVLSNLTRLGFPTHCFNTGTKTLIAPQCVCQQHTHTHIYLNILSTLLQFKNHQPNELLYVLCRMSCSPSFFPEDRVLAFHVITPRSVNSCNQHCSLHAGWIPAEALAPTIHRSPVPNTVTARRMPHFQGREEDSAEWATYDHCFPDTRQKWMKRGEQIKVEKVGEG